VFRGPGGSRRFTPKKKPIGKKKGDSNRKRGGTSVKKEEGDRVFLLLSGIGGVQGIAQIRGKRRGRLKKKGNLEKRRKVSKGKEVSQACWSKIQKTGGEGNISTGLLIKATTRGTTYRDTQGGRGDC